ncbi:MAG: glycosyltransferase [Firmicutes bacterium]|nr:glycosyltransferase [Bacillota bacterium]
MQPLLSIVIPIYNNEMTLSKMVDSILSQNFDDWELLLVDDGSTDSCKQLVDDYAKLDNRIKSFHKKNGGTYSGFNFGLKQANGKYIIFACADDTFDLFAFETVANQAYEFDYDIIFIQSTVHYVDNEQNILCTNATNSQNIPLKLTNKTNVENNWDNFIITGVAYSPVNAYKSTIIKKYSFKEDIYAADTLMNIEIADNINSASYNPKILYNRYIYKYIKNENFNISSGKFYPYEHDMWDDIYIKSKNLFLKWKTLDEENIKIIALLRITQLDNEIHGLSAFNNKNTPTENICTVMGYCTDAIFEAAAISDNLPKLDDRIFNAIYSIIQNNELPSDFETPVLRMFTAINNTAISVDEIKSEITNSLLDYQNPYRIGFETYKTLSTNYPKIANQALLAYLKTEQTARKQLFTGNLEQALDTTIQLFNSKISTPEQYITLALCGYHLGLTEDAKNAVETGLQNFPNYPRLEELQNIINANQ